LFLAESAALTHSWPNVSTLREAAGRSPGSTLSEEVSKGLSALLSPGRHPRQASDAPSNLSAQAPASSQAQGISASRLIRAAGKSASVKVNNS
jgi:hypothetical protein